MKEGDVITGKLVGFRYGQPKGFDRAVCFIDVVDADDTKHKALLGDADAYPFPAMLSLRREQAELEMECTDPEKGYFKNVTFKC
jgi:hypothetical protein